jgi:hypothetical protein
MYRRGETGQAGGFAFFNQESERSVMSWHTTVESSNSAVVCRVDQFEVPEVQ